MLLRAFAKVNLDLRVLGRRPDGYNDVRTILQAIDWCDEIRIENADAFEFIAHGAPQGEDNLVLRAVRTYERLTGIAASVRIELTKNVPIGAGLGGGSADAAVTLLGLERFYDRTLSKTDLYASLRALGSDVPFFAIGGRAVGIGRGDEVYPLEDTGDYHIVVIRPDVSISTAEAYSWLTVSDRSNTIEGFCVQFLPGSGQVPLRNDFERPVFRRHPGLAHAKQELLRSGARQAALSGSGAALFGIFDDEQQAVKAAADLMRLGIAKATSPLPRSEYLRRIIGD